MQLLERKIDAFLADADCFVGRGSTRRLAGQQKLRHIKGAIYENAVGEMLRKSGYEQLYFYRHDNPSLEMDFFVRDANSLVPVEVKARDGDFFFHNWLRNRNTIEFLGIWEKVHNPSFNSVEFDIIKSQAGLHNYRFERFGMVR